MSNKNILSQIESTRLPKNMFDLSHEHKLSCNMAQLVPVLCLECVPSDKVYTSQEALVRLAPLVAPMMHRVDVTFHTFFVPHRLVWKNWEEFIMNKPISGNIPVHPTLEVYPAVHTKLHDYFGIPNGSDVPVVGQSEYISALPFAAYQMIYNDYYRDQNNIPTEIPYQLVDGNNSPNIALTVLRNRAWEHDYFTSALPSSQFGAPVTIPLLGDAEVKLNRAGMIPGTQSGFNSDFDFPNSFTTKLEESTTTPVGKLYADLGTANVTTVRDLRIAFKLQEWAEKMMRGGRRFVEFLQVMFGVNNQDVRLQRPEYITGTKSPVVISEVLNTTGTANAPQGNMAGHGISVVNGSSGGYYCPEHGHIITIMSVMPKTGYQQGIAKMWLKRTFTDYFTPQFANVGEQEIQIRELMAYQTIGGNTFGYTPRYADYKYAPNRVSGDFKTSLDFWHLNRKFASIPALNQDFVECKPIDTMRVFAVTDPSVDHLWIQIYNKVKAIRPMPVFGTPNI